MATIKRILWFFITAGILAACNTTANDSESLRNQLVGEWRNTYLKVTMPSAGGVADSVGVLEADSTNWDTVVGIRPIHTFFLGDSTYHSDHYNLNDSLLFSAKGNWMISHDTLIMQQHSPNVAVYRMKTSVNGNTVRFHGKLDFDEDGQEDDEYIGWQKKY